MVKPCWCLHFGVCDCAALPDFPQNTQIEAHYREFLKNGYKISAESVECKFPTGDGSRTIFPGSVGISDGFCKVLIMVGISLACHQLETWLNMKNHTIVSVGVRLLFQTGVHVCVPALR